jgi:diacylglycerol kinase family enzyme
MTQIAPEKILFIINQKAGATTVHDIIVQLQKRRLAFHITDSLDALREVMHKEMDRYTVFVAVGGDGTANALAHYLIGKKEKILAVLPTGSGNGFASELGFKKNVRDLIQIITAGRVIQADSILVNGYPCINVGGIGFDAEVAAAFQKTQRGFLHYILTSVKTFSKYQPAQFTIQADGTSVSGTYLMLSIANNRQYGNRAFVSPDSVPDDGRFELVGVKPAKGWRTLPVIYRLFKGQLKSGADVEVITSGGEVKVQSNCLLFHVDGETIASSGTYTIRLQPQSLQVIDTGRMPAKMAQQKNGKI